MEQQSETVARLGAAQRLVLAGRFAALLYLNILVWLSISVLLPTFILGLRPMALDSGSMTPSIRPGDVVMAAPYRNEALEPGRVITFEDPARPGHLVTHRIIAVNDDGTWTSKGDANLVQDSTPLSVDQIRGVARMVIPRVGLPVIWVQQGDYLKLFAWLASVMLALGLLSPTGRNAESAPLRQPGPTREARPARPARQARRGRLARPAPAPIAALPTAPKGWALPSPPQFAPVAYAPAAAAPAFTYAAPATVPAVRYRVRLPQPPAALLLPEPPRWSVSFVPPAPGTTLTTTIPAPPRPAATRRGSAALSSREVPGWSGRLHTARPDSYGSN